MADAQTLNPQKDLEVASDLTADSISEETLEARAFIYQQLQDIEHLLPDQAQIAVSIQQVWKTNNETRVPEPPRYRVKLSFDLENGKVVASGLDEDVYESALEAKEEMTLKLEAIHEHTNSSRERDLEVRNLLQNNWLH